MATTQTSAHEAPTNSGAKQSDEHKPASKAARRAPTDDEILGISPEPANAATSEAARSNSGASARRGTESATRFGEAEAEGARTEPENFRTFDEDPELREAWQDAAAYREAFATPAEAREATELLADLNRMDALFFSRRPEDHVALARAVAELDPGAFASLVKAMNGLSTETEKAAEHANRGKDSSEGGRDGQPSSRYESARPAQVESEKRPGSTTAAQEDFFHATNAAAVQSVLDAVESQVERLLPERASKSTRNRVVGEIYRELDNTLRSNRQLAQQMREAFRSGALDAEHQRAIVSLVVGRARQALPGVARRVLHEWTSTVVATNQDRRARQRAAEGRVDIAGSNRTGSESRRQTTPRDIDYARMSDADILNL